METKALVQLIDRVRENNPYPVDVFPEPSDEDWKGIGEFLLAHGKNPDRIFAKWGRQVWENCLLNLEDLMPDQKSDCEHYFARKQDGTLMPCEFCGCGKDDPQTDH